MKITGLRTAAIDGHGEWILIQVLTDTEHVGLGEAFPVNPGCGRAACELVQWTAPFLKGEDPTDVSRAVERLYRYYTNRGAAHTGGLFRSIVAGVEIALWDLAGKALGAPLYRLFGGKFRESIRLYADCHAGVTNTRADVHAAAEEHGAYEPEAYARRAQQLIGEGFRALKFDLQRLPSSMPDAFNRTLSNAELRTAVAQLTAVRDAAGPDIEIALDIMSALDVPSAIRLGRALVHLNLLWMEEPVPPENLDALAQVTMQCGVPICTGENLYTLHQFEQLFLRKAAHVIEPDFQKTGLLEGRRIADLAHSYYIPVAPHCVSTPVGTMASVHLCAAIPNFLLLEFHEFDIPWWAELAKDGSALIRDGQIQVPDKPGIGIELDYAAVARHTVHGGLTPS